MSPQVWWYFARAAGIVAWALLTLTVLWGIIMSTDLFARWRRKAWLLDLHRWLGALSLMTLAVHLAALMADSYIKFDVVDLVVPFASDYKPWQVALGVLAMWGLIAVEVSSLLMKRLPKRLWRGIHFTSYAVFVLTSFHGTFVGTDATSPMYLVTTALTTSALVGALTYRIITRRSARPPRHDVGAAAAAAATPAGESPQGTPMTTPELSMGPWSNPPHRPSRARTAAPRLPSDLTRH